MKKLLLVLTVVAMASLLITGCLPTPNTAPVITTTALPNATVGLVYTATVEATDADGDALTFSKVSGPTDMVISAAGAISGWTPAAVGAEAVTVAVTDGTDSVSADYTITVVAAPPVNTAPVIIAIANHTTILGETYTYAVVATDAEGGTLTYSLTTFPLLMEISAAGVITWTPEFATQLGPHAVVVRVSDPGGLFDTEDFILTVVEPEPPEPPEPLVIDIDIPGAYPHPTKGLIVSGLPPNDCYDVTVTFSDNSITEGQSVWVRWNDVNVTAIEGCLGEWILLEGNVDETEFIGEICFDGVCTECKLICIEVLVGDLCCAGIIHSEMITVDSVVPCASFTVTIEDCTQDPCAPEPGASMFWTTTCLDECDLGYDCCGDNCSGVGDWSFILDETECAPACDDVYGINCPISGAFECGCLLYSEDEAVPVEHVVDVTITDNVGNEFTDTWTLTFDTDELIDFANGSGSLSVTGNAVDGWEVKVDYGCTWDDCEECMPSNG